MIRKKVKC